MSTCAVVFGASTSVKFKADLFPVTERGRPLGASQASPCPLGWPVGV